MYDEAAYAYDNAVNTSETACDYRARYYDSTVGRFVSEDPIRFRAGVNFYRYVRNNSLLYVDPSGNDWGFGLIGGSTMGVGVPGYESHPQSIGNGALATAGGGSGFFYNFYNGLTTGSFATFGSFLGGSNLGPSYPGPTCQRSRPNGFSGAVAGLGGGVFVTNAGSSQQLQGPFDTTIVNLYFAEFQYSTSNGTWIVSITAGPASGAGIGNLSTMTVATDSSSGSSANFEGVAP